MANSGRPSNENAPRVPGEERPGLPWGRIIATLIVLALLALLIPFACQALRGGGGAGNTEQEQNGDQEQGASGETTNGGDQGRSEEHTSELQSRQYIVCRLLLEKKKNK